MATVVTLVSMNQHPRQYITPPTSSQIENRSLMLVYQFMGGVIICLAILFCGTLFLCLWMIPVMALFYATGLKW